MNHKHEQWLVRLRAEGIFFVRALKVLARPALGLLTVAIIGAVIHHHFGGPPGGPKPSWTDSFFISYCLLLLEHIELVPQHPAAQLVHYLQPIVGILLFSEGILKLGFTVFKKEENARSWMTIMAKASRDHVVLCALGNVGFRVLESLVELDVKVFAIEHNAECPFLERARDLGAEVLVGDARANELLESMNLDKARAVILATDDDLANLEVAMDVRELRSDIPIVMRMFDQRLAQKVRGSLGVNVSVSTSKVAGPLLAGAALDPAVVGTHRIGNRNMVVLDLLVRDGGALSGTPGSLRREHQVDVIALQPQDSDWQPCPPEDQPIRPGQRIQTLVDSRRIQEVHGLNGPA